MTDEELARFAALEQRVGVLEQLAGLDVLFLRRLFPALAARFGDKPFTLAEARRDAGLRLLLGDRSAAALGKLFARAAGLVIDGYELEQLGRHGSRALWRLWRRAG